MAFTVDADTLRVLSMVEQMTGARVRDCIPGETMVFIVEEGEIGKAIGKGGRNVRDLERLLKKRVKIVEYNQDLVKFTQNVVAPIELSGAELQEDKLLLTAKDLKSRGLLIGRSASNLRFFEGIIQRYFPIKELRVV